MDYRFTINGLNFTATVRHDEDMGAPWKEHDGHGVVTEWVARDKKPGERLLSMSAGHKRFYDVQASMDIALKDGWGCSNPEGKTKGQIAAEAVENDFEYLRAWCNDEWHWVYVVVQLVDTDGRPVPGYSESLGGIESTEEDYVKEQARELAESLAERVGDSKEICIPVRK